MQERGIYFLNIGFISLIVQLTVYFKKQQKEAHSSENDQVEGLDGKGGKKPLKDATCEEPLLNST